MTLERDLNSLPSYLPIKKEEWLHCKPFGDSLITLVDGLIRFILFLLDLLFLNPLHPRGAITESWPSAWSIFMLFVIRWFWTPPNGEKIGWYCYFRDIWNIIDAATTWFKTRNSLLPKYTFYLMNVLFKM